ncbi:MAG TPA: TonB-dependent receptor [Thermoanaerobaculia bacterium]|nr:TonB-dependent receptor [Thermoanaerobaculia bacterium]
MPRKVLSAACAILFAALCLFPAKAAAQTADPQTSGSSLDELLDVKVSGASKHEQTARQAPASVTIITSEDIERYGYRTLADALMTVRGFFVSYDRAYTYVGVRGFSRPTDYNNRILLLLDGHTLNENVYGSAPLGSEFPIELDLVDHIEVIRGPGAALYGTGAMLAVVNVVLKKGSALNGGRLALGAGSYGRLQGTISAGKELERGPDLLVSVFGSDVKGEDQFYPEYNSPETSNGVAHDLDTDRSYGGIASATWGGFHLTALSTSRAKGIPTGAFEMEFDNPVALYSDRHRFLDLRYEHAVTPNLQVTARVYAHHYGYEGTFPYELTFFDSTDNDWYGSELRAQWDPLPNNRVTAGVEYRNDTRADYRAFDAENVYFDGNFPFHVTSFYIQDEFQVTPSLALIAGLRHDQYSTIGSSTNPRAAIVFNPSPSSTAKLLYGRAFRAPNVYEMHYLSDVAEANLRLQPERIETIEAIWEQRLSSSFFGTVSLYQSRITDLIDQTLDPEDGLLQFRNVGSALARGAEVGLTARFAGGVSGYASYAYQKASDGSGFELSNSPDQAYKLGVSFPVIGPIRMSGEVLHETGRLTAQNTRTASYFLSNLTLSVEPSGRIPVRVLAQIRNLFDADYESPVGFEHRQAAIGQDGRNYALKLEYRF